MADTKRSKASILSLLADNASGAISAQDLRDAVVSLAPDYGEMHITTPAATTISDTTSFFDASGTYMLDSPALDWDMNTNGQLRYIGVPDRVVDILGSFSIIGASNNQVLHFVLAKNGTPISAGEIKRKIGAGADVGAGMVHGLTSVSTNDYLTLEVRNETSPTNVTFETLEVFARGMIL